MAVFTISGSPAFIRGVVALSPVVLLVGRLRSRPRDSGVPSVEEGEAQGVPG